MHLNESQARRTYVPEFFWQIALIHGVALLAAPWFFTWPRFIFAFGLGMWFGHSMGIFHHMLLTHRSFKIVRPLEYLGALLGTLTWRGPMAAPIRYVAMHRVHHIYSDQEPDPHSPIHGYGHALLGWFWFFPQVFVAPKDYEPLAGLLAEDRFMQFLDRNVNLLQGVLGLLIFTLAGVVPWLSGSSSGFAWENAWGFLIYGVFVKSFLLIYLANAVDVVNHSVGYRNYDTKDLSTNSSLMGAVHLGGAISWHNNHHAHPSYFKVKKQWWELDVHYAGLKLLEKLGLVENVKILDETKNGAELSA